MWLLLTCFLLKVIFIIADDSLSYNNAFDLNLYKDVLDPEECARQLDYINRKDKMLKMQFLDAGARFPKGILTGNMRDMGNYFQCLAINKEEENMFIEGKYCVMRLSLRQNDLRLPIASPLIIEPNSTWARSVTTILDEKVMEGFSSFNNLRSNMEMLLGENDQEPSSRVAAESPFASLRLELAVCLPKVCSVKNAVEILTPNVLGSLEVEEAFCRLPNDKPWVAADTVAVVLFSLIGLVTLLSTGYDLLHNVILKKDPKQTKPLYTSTTFSLFTNSRNLFIFNTKPNDITCLDGIRSIAMMWVIVGHTFFLTSFFVTANPSQIISSITEFSFLWITSAPITIDTFFMISGLLLVYTTASKLSRMNLLKNLHLFYFHRLVRLFPVLATVVLMQASILNRVTDGPYWYANARNTDRCRQYWWSTLLYVQNFVNPESMCLGHAWYLAVDMQLYIISPIVLFWVLGGNRRSAWTALAGALMTVLTASTIYNYLMDFQTSTTLNRRGDSSRYMRYHYLHTLPRAAPFFVGMVFGYVLHLCKEKTIRLPKHLVVLFWTMAFGTSTVVFISTYITIQPDWNNETVDNILNSFKRPAWAASVAWLVFACAKGYGGPINWFLSLHIFKILSRLSYAMYVLHYPLISVINGTTLAPIFFSVENYMQLFLIHFSVTVIAAYIITVVIDLPFSRLIGGVLKGKKDQEIPNAKKSNKLRKIKDNVLGFHVADHKTDKYKYPDNLRYPEDLLEYYSRMLYY